MHLAVNNGRSCKGNTLLKSLLFFAVVLIALIALCSGFLNLKINKGKSYSPIEIAALEASKNISTVCVNTKEFGYVSLAYYPSSNTKLSAQDGYSLPVRSINDLLATIRLNLIVAKELELPLMNEFAKEDYSKLLIVKDKLVNSLKKSVEPGEKSKNKDGKELEIYAIAEQAYIDALPSDDARKAYKKGALSISIGSLKQGLPTAVKIPQPERKADLKENQSLESYYLSYTSIKTKDLDFVFGGVGKNNQIVKTESWIAEVDGLPYQFPTIVKVERIEENGQQIKEIACAQPASKMEYKPVTGALTISFPDGPVPEITSPKDLYLNKQLISPELLPMKIVSAKGGDYPVDSGAYLEPYIWPINKTNNWAPTADVWKLAIYDWIRRAGPRANIASIVKMQEVTLDSPRPQNLLWKAPLVHGSNSLTLQPIPSGIIHIFEFDEDGIIDYRSKIMMPYPLYSTSNEQLYGKGIAALTFSEVGEKTIHIPTNPTPKKIILKAAWDAYIRDEIRSPGSISGGKHGGEPLAMPLLSFGFETDISNRLSGIPYWRVENMALSEEEEGTARVYDKGKGIGFQPLIAPQSDFAESMNPKPPFVRPMPFGRGARPLQKVSATAIDIRFRRQIDVSKLNGELSTGYFGIVKPED